MRLFWLDGYADGQAAARQRRGLPPPSSASARPPLGRTPPLARRASRGDSMATAGRRRFGDGSPRLLPRLGGAGDAAWALAARRFLYGWRHRGS